MTPKEKAKELFNKFNNPDRTNYPYVHNAQQCALIAVDEMIEVAKSLTMETQEWYEEVKTEIEKL